MSEPSQGVSIQEEQQYEVAIFYSISICLVYLIKLEWILGMVQTWVCVSVDFVFSDY